MTVREALRWAENELREIPDPRLDAEYLLAEALHTPRLALLTEKARMLAPDRLSAFEALVARRKTREPLQYILGEQSFMGFSFRVDPRALIPRQDTEAVCEEALRHLRPGMRALDLCTGTGAIAVSLKKLCPGAEVTASDISAGALTLARENAAALQAEVRFLEGDLFAPLAGETFDLIVSNPPYIPEGLRGALQAEVEREPALALFAGPDGLRFYRRIAREAPAHLRAGGRLILETGDGEAEGVCRLLAERFEEIAVFRDLGGLPRGVSARKKEGAHGSAV